MRDTVDLFKALADETRLRILHLLTRRELCVCQIVEVLRLGQSKVSRHLAHLRNAGLVHDRRDGLWMYYSLAQPDGRLQSKVLEWLRHAADELPRAAEDLQTLNGLGECTDLCDESSSDEDAGQDGGMCKAGS